MSFVFAGRNKVDDDMKHGNEKKHRGWHRKGRCGKNRCCVNAINQEHKVFLDKVKVGESGVVKTLNAAPVIRKRLLAMGLTPGVGFKVVKVAPMGDPIEIQVRGYQLTMRKNEASCVEIVQAG